MRRPTPASDDQIGQAAPLRIPNSALAAWLGLGGLAAAECCTHRRVVSRSDQVICCSYQADVAEIVQLAVTTSKALRAWPPTLIPDRMAGWPFGGSARRV
jgi:hypothetical protein